ncbi:MAG TPA: cell division/cell wall cluster transcriptional repressor MraZ [Erysipelotrichaceae bacterium]|jgi:MraZ protein|nr:cell division/cell wall cluster transcriptional repressor MraZ [Erysipelotrichaceae bacterium]
MFIGEYTHNLDSKNRITMPSKFRDGFGETFIITKGLDGCLTAYKMDQWEVLLSKLEQLPTTKRESRLYVRGITSKATECQFDSQGRIQIPTYLITEADLVKQCVFVGVGSHVEIWSKERWEEYYKVASDSFEEIAESLTDFLK